MKGVFTILDELLEKRYEHEVIAKEKLVKEITNPVFRQQLEQGGFGNEHRIIVIGGSGVGKTTLILWLLGAKSNEEDNTFNIANLAKFIRGNTDKAGAGTATVTRYEVNQNEYGEVVFPNDNERKSFTTLEELSDVLKSIRIQVESGEWSQYDPVTIKLPSQYFKEQTAVKWVITDLPGINSVARDEYIHVSNLMKAWVLQSNVFLIVETASQIAQLNTLQIPGIGSWKLFSRRARLIITRSLTEHSILEWLEVLGTLSSETLVNEYMQKLTKERISLSGIGGVFPMDYGSSWDKLQENKPDIYLKVKDAMSGMRAALLSNLEESLSPEEEFKTLQDLGNVNTLLEQKIEKIVSQINEFQFEKNILMSERSNDEKAIDELEQFVKTLKEERLKMISTAIPRFPDCRDKLRRHLNNHNPDHPDAHYKKWNQLAEEVKKEIRFFSKSTFKSELLVEGILETRYPEDFPAFVKQDWRQFTSNTFNQSYLHTIAGKYFPFWDPKNNQRDRARNEHRQALYVGLEQVHAKTLNQINTISEEIRDARVDEIQNEITRKSGFIANLKSGIETTNSNIELIDSEINILKNEIDYLHNSMSNDLEIFKKRYPKIRKEELEFAVGEYMSLAKKSKSVEEAFQYMSFVDVIKQVSFSIGNLNEGANVL